MMESVISPYVYPITTKKGVDSISVSLLISTTCEYFCVKPYELKKSGYKYTFPRFILMYLLNEKGIRPEEIMKMFDKDRTAFYFGINKIKGFIKIRDEMTIRALNEIKKICHND